MYRSRLGGGPGKRLLDYVSSVGEDAGIAEYDILGSQAHAVMLLDCGLIGRADAAAILSALEGLRGRELRGGGHEDVHELVESLVAEAAGPESGGRLQTARSRNDQVSADLRMKVRDDILSLCGLALDAAGALVDAAARHSGAVMPLYTHMQQAQAGSLPHYLLAHADALLRDCGRLEGAYGRANRSPLGAGPAGGTSLPIDREAAARMLGFDGLVENSADAASTRDFAAEFAAAAAILMSNLSRLAEDLVVWSTSEFGFVELDDGLASPSSVMPQKKNPDVLELTRGRAARAAGELVGILSATKGLATGYGRDLQEVKPMVMSSSRLAAGALAAVRDAVSTMRVDEAAMRRAAGSGYLEALDVAEGLVRRGVPFRAAHEVVGRLVRAAHAAGVPLSGTGPADAAAAARGSPADPADVAELAAAAGPEASLAARASRGSPAPAEVGRMIPERRAEIAARRGEVGRMAAAVGGALDGLAARVREIAG